MLDKPNCLHIPPLYEESTARIVWESVNDADGYELDVHYDEDFETASTGKRWTDVDMSTLSMGEIEAMDLTWERIAKLPAQGFSWMNAEFHNPAWGEIDASSLSWQDIQKLPAEFTAFKGNGEKTQGPDQGLVWSNINSSGLDWSQMEALGQSWDDFMFQPSVGINWGQIESDQKAWAEIEVDGKTWHQFERQAARGLGWDSLNAGFLDWSEIAAKSLTWQQFENLPADSKTHIAHVVNIPIYKKKAIFRVRAYKDAEYSEYLTSTLINTLPRSLAKYKPPCLHIPKLYREGTADIIWGDLYGASGYIVERKMSSESNFKVVYDGAGKLVPDPKNCNVVKELYYTPDCKRHFQFTDQIPIYETTAQYRIKGYNTTDESQHLISEIITLLPRSLAKYKVPCLHIPELHEGQAEEIIWGDLYDASSYVIERKLGDKSYSSVFDGPGKPVPHPANCDNPKLLSKTPDCKQHLAHSDQIPYYEKTAQYRIKGYNTTDSSQYLESAVVPIIPVFYRDDAFSWTAVKDNVYRLEIRGDNIRTFSTVILNLEYSTTEMSLTDFAAQVPNVYTNPGMIPQANLEILSNTNGKVRFKCSRVVPSNEEWSGIVTVLEFKAIKSGNVQIKLY